MNKEFCGYTLQNIAYSEKTNEQLNDEFKEHLKGCEYCKNVDDSLRVQAFSNVIKDIFGG